MVHINKTMEHIVPVALVLASNYDVQRKEHRSLPGEVREALGRAWKGG